MYYKNDTNGIYISASDNCGVYNNLVDENFRGIVIAGIPRKSYTLFNNMVENNIIINNKDAEIVIEPDQDG